MKIIVDQAIPYIKDRIPDEVETVYMAGNAITEKEVKDAVAMVIRTRTLCNESLLKDSTVKLVATATIGTDHIDIPWCEKNGIMVKSAPGCNAPGVAQYVLSSLMRAGFDRRHHTLGIIGYGNVGSTVADWAKQIGIRVKISDPPRKDSGHTDAEYLEMKELLSTCEALTLHVPLTDSGLYPTNKMIGKEELSMMSRGTILINSSRGGVVDEESLKEKLREGGIKAVVDVWENEPEIDPELVDLAFIATPHIAGYSEEGKKRGTGMALQALEEILGVNVNIKGLECIPPVGRSVTRELIEGSYNPLDDTRKLKSAVSDFEFLRNNYNYRHEPLFMQ